MEQQAEYGTTMTISSLKAADYNPRKIEEENFTADNQHKEWLANTVYRS